MAIDFNSKVTGPGSSVDSNVAVFSGTTGKVVKDSGFKIAKSVPADAKFTDTVVSVNNTLTSDSTSAALSAAQGKALKNLVDGKAASNHTHSNYAASSHTHSNYVLNSNGGNISIHADSDSSSASEYALIKAGHNELKVISSAGGSTVTKGQDKLQFNGYSVYHKGYKPSLSDLGAAASNHTHSNYAASSHTHNYAGSSSAGGNANAAVKLVTARSINGTNFDGTGNITTANWGTARNFTIGNSTKSVNGSGNMSWSLSEIGAAASNHTHSNYAASNHSHDYLPLAGGTLSKPVTVQTATATSDDEAMYVAKRTANGGEIRFGIGGSGKAGMYSPNLEQWLVYTDGSNVSYCMRNEWSGKMFHLAFRVGGGLSGQPGFITFSC